MITLTQPVEHDGQVYASVDVREIVDPRTRDERPARVHPLHWTVAACTSLPLAVVEQLQCADARAIVDEMDRINSTAEALKRARAIVAEGALVQRLRDEAVALGRAPANPAWPWL